MILRRMFTHFISSCVSSFGRSAGRMLAPLMAVPVLAASTFAVTLGYGPDDEAAVVINDSPDQEIIVFGKSVVVKRQAKGVLAVGGDVIVEGSVSGDVAAVGGNITQKKEAYIGGDVIVFGGTYRPEDERPLRAEGRETVVFAVFEEELRALGQDPKTLLASDLTPAFFAQRTVLAFFWFLVSMVLATLAPGAVSRSALRLRLSYVSTIGVGIMVFFALVMLIVGAALLLPEYLGLTVFIIGIVVSLLAYVLGRVSIHLVAGKFLLRLFRGGSESSETLAMLVGVLALTVLLSLPYVWPLALFTVLFAGLGLMFPSPFASVAAK